MRPVISSDAILSDDQRFRYSLSRTFAPLDGQANWAGRMPRGVMFVGLNPSTADAAQDDPTIRRCIGFAQDWGFDKLWMANLFAFRATCPRDLIDRYRQGGDIVGRNDYHLREQLKRVSKVVACWGSTRVPDLQPRAERIKAMCAHEGHKLWCLGRNKDGQPKHPLYLSKETELELLWEPPRRSRTWTVWAEGFAATGQSGQAQIMGTAYAETFQEACDMLAREQGWGSLYNTENRSYWGCSLYPTEEQARVTFG